MKTKSFQENADEVVYFKLPMFLSGVTYAIGDQEKFNQNFIDLEQKIMSHPSDIPHEEKVKVVEASKKRLMDAYKAGMKPEAN